MEGGYYHLIHHKRPLRSRADNNTYPQWVVMSPREPTMARSGERTTPYKTSPSAKRGSGLPPQLRVPPFLLRIFPQVLRCEEMKWSLPAHLDTAQPGRAAAGQGKHGLQKASPAGRQARGSALAKAPGAPGRETEENHFSDFRWCGNSAQG